MTENGDSDTYSLVLNNEPTADVTINVITNSQIEAITPLTFTPTNWFTPQTVEVVAVDDEIEEGDHVSTIRHEVADGSAAEFLNSIIGDVTANITDNDVPGVTITQTDGSTDVIEGVTSDTYEIVLNQQPTDSVVINLASLPADIPQISLIPINLIFTPDNWDIPQEITVESVDDIEDEGNHSSIITHTIDNDNSAAEYQNLEIENVVVNIIDNEQPGISIFPTDGSTDVTEGGGTDTFRIILNRQPTADVIIDVTTDSQLEAIASITFTPDNWDEFQEITVEAADDFVAEGNHNSTIELEVSAGSAIEYVGLPIDSLTVNITDNDVADVIITQTDDSTEVTEDGVSDTYTVVLTSQPTEDVIIQINNDEELTTTPTELTFSATDWFTPQQVTVQAVDDNIDEGDIHTSTITHTFDSNSATEFLNVIIDDVTVSITDDDTAGIIVEETDGSTEVIEGVASDTYTIVLTSEPSTFLTIEFETDEELQPIPNLTFDSTNWDQPQTITVSARDDVFIDEDTTSTIQHTITEDSAAEFANIAIGDITVTVTEDPNETASPNDGDRNLDGIIDNQQSNVFSLPKLNGDPNNPDDILTVISPIDTILANVAINGNPATDDPDDPEDNGVVFPIGFLEFDVFNIEPGSSALVSILLPESTNNENFNTYWIYGPTPELPQDHWFEFLYDGETGAQFFDIDGNGSPDQVLLHFVDGERGDKDLEANGTILDPGAPGVTTTPLSLNEVSQDILEIEGDGGIAPLKFTLQNSNSDLVNEVGVFRVDAENRVNGIAPGEIGFADAALSSASVIFSSLSDESDSLVAGTNFTRQLQFSAGDRLMFYLAANSTRDTILRQGINANNLFFSTPLANTDGLDHLQVIEDNGTFTIAWEEAFAGSDLDLDDLILSVEIADQPLTLQQLLALQQGNEEGEVIDLTFLAGQQVRVTIPMLESEASFSNFVGLYRIENEEGTVINPQTGEEFAPGAIGYTEAAILQSQQNGLAFSQSSTGATVNLTGGAFLAPFIIADGTPSQVLDGDSSNDPNVFFAFSDSNFDGFDHIRLLADNTFGFEDLPSGGDEDFNDVIFEVDLTLV